MKGRGVKRDESEPGYPNGIREWVEELLAGKSDIATPGSIYHLVNELQTRQFELAVQNEQLGQMAPQDIQRLVGELEKQNRELRQTQEELRASERKYRQLVENMQEGVCIFDTAARITFANPRLAEMLGYSSEELVGRPVFEFMDEYWGRSYRCYLGQSNKKIPRGVELELICKDGSSMHARVEASPILDEQGRHAGIVACIADITDQVAAEQAVHLIQKQVQCLIDSNIIGIVIADLDGYIIEANEAFLKITGYSREDLQNNSLKWDEITPPEYGSVDEKALDQLFTQGHCSPFEKEYRRQDGRRVPILLGGALWDTSSANPVWVCFVLDISETKRAERERETLLQQVDKEKSKAQELAHTLARERDILKVGMENAGAMLAYVDPDLNFVKVNSAYARARGYTADELIGRNHFELFPNEENETACRYVRDTGKPVTLRDRPYSFPDNPASLTYLDWTITPVLSSDKVEGLVISQVDTTQRKLAEEVLHKTKQELEVAVAERTAELMIINEELQKEVAERRQTEDELQKKETSLRLILEQMPLVLWTTDRELRFTSRSGAGLSSLNQAPGQFVVGQTVQEYLGTDDPDFPPLATHYRALAGAPSSYERVNNNITFYCYVEPLRDSSGNITGVIGTAIDITGRKRIEEELRQISRRLVDAQENERRNIARELHDQVSQSLALLKIFMDKAMRSPQDKEKFNWDEARALIMEMITQIRDLSLNLRPKMLDDLGLLPTLLWHIDRYTGQTHIRVNFKQAGLKKNFAPEVSTAAYRIVQEALSNVARHARVDEVSVRVWANRQNLSVQVKDEGVGFDPARLSSVSAGLSGMRERVLLLGGKLSINTTPGKGTCITTQLPLSGWPPTSST